METSAYTAWLMPDRSAVTVVVPQAAFDRWLAPSWWRRVLRLRRLPPGRPHQQAIWLCGGGGVPEGQPIGWSYSRATAGPPIDGQSQVEGFRVVCVGDRTTYDPIATAMENHHSVTFDAVSSAQNDGAIVTLTWSHTTTTNADRYLSVFSMVSDVMTSVTYAAAALTQQLTQGFLTYWDKIAPATGANNVVITTADLSIHVGVAYSAYGVHQTTPRTATANTTATNTAPTFSGMASATDELCISAVGTDYNPNYPTSDDDATWTSDVNLINTGGDMRVIAQHKTGAATVGRTDSFDVSALWAMLGVSLKSAAASGRTTKNTRSHPLGVRLGRGFGIGGS